MIFSELRASAWKYAAIGGACLTLAAGATAGIQSWRLDVAQKALALVARDYARADAKAQRAAREEEQTRARYIAGVAEAYEKGKADAQAAGDRVAADLRAGNVQLRQRWQGCEARRVPGAAAAPGEPDAAAADRAESAGRIVGAAAACDAQIRGLQEVIKADRR